MISSKLLLNETAIYRDLDNTWAVVAEGIQTILRREAYPSPYEALKALTRTNEGINEKSIRDFVETLDVSQPTISRALAAFEEAGLIVRAFPGDGIRISVGEAESLPRVMAVAAAQRG